MYSEPHGRRSGEIVGGKYRVVRRLGAGGMGVVYEAEHIKLAQPVALKMLHPDSSRDAELVSRFEREARATVRLKSPHVATVMDIDKLADGTPYMVLELLRGHDLSRELGRRGPLPPQEAVSYVLQACAAIAEAHQHGIVHRDLKPSNLFLCPVGDTVLVKVLDFGISKILVGPQTMNTQTESSLGTPFYMSPEQIRSAKAVDHRTDIWSLGVVLYELITGVLPFEGDNPTAVVAAIAADAPIPILERTPDLPADLAAAVMRALEKSLERRYGSIAELVAALRPFESLTLKPSSSLVPAEGESAGKLMAATTELAPLTPERSATSAKTESHSIGNSGWSAVSTFVGRKRGKHAIALAIGIGAGITLAWWSVSKRTARSEHVDIAAVPSDPPQKASAVQVSIQDPPTPSAAPAATVSVAPSPTTSVRSPVGRVQTKPKARAAAASIASAAPVAVSANPRPPSPPPAPEKNPLFL